MSFAGARSAGDRRRRRMAVGHDHGTERSPENGESIPLADLLQKTMAGRSLKLIPGLPVRLWVVWLTISLATLSVAFASWLLIAHTSLPAFFAPITQRLFSSTDAVFFDCARIRRMAGRWTDLFPDWLVPFSQFPRFQRTVPGLVLGRRLVTDRFIVQIT